MINKEQIKAEIDNIKDEHLVILYRVIKALEIPAKEQVKRFSKKSEWHGFIQETYGCLLDAPIERGIQGVCDIREEIK